MAIISQQLVVTESNLVLVDKTEESRGELLPGDCVFKVNKNKQAVESRVAGDVVAKQVLRFQLILQEAIVLRTFDDLARL